MSVKKVLIAMSGGVDSSVAAWISLQEGYECIGATMVLCDTLPGCSPTGHDTDARAVAQRLGMDFCVLDSQDVFRDNVVEDFVRSYEAGLTPNPCIVCNRTVKFGYLLEQAKALGCDGVVTGHYAQIKYDENSGRYLLYKAADSAKDQSYFLASLTQEQLRCAKFPLGAMTKERARQIAEAQGFINAKKRDSQDICFIPDGDYVAFLRKYTQKEYPCGNYLNTDGKVVGQHKGAVAYTLGQRKGLGIALGAPVYVCAKDMDANTVTVGAEEHLFSNTLVAENWNWIPFPALTEPMRVTAKARSRHNGAPATVYPEENGVARVVFDEPQRAITPGQSVVLYDGDLVIGSGTIISAK